MCGNFLSFLPPFYRSHLKKQNTSLQICRPCSERKGFSRQPSHSPLGIKLEDYIIGNQVGKGSNAVVYEAAAKFAKESAVQRSLLQLREDKEEEGEEGRSLTCCSFRNFPLAIKMIWNFGVSVFTKRFRNSPVLRKQMSVTQHTTELIWSDWSVLILHRRVHRAMIY